MAKKTYEWMPTKEGGSKAKVETQEGTQGWVVQPLVIAGTTYFELKHCAKQPDYSSPDGWTTMTRRHEIKKAVSKRTAEPLNASMLQGCADYILEKDYTGIEGHGFRLKELVFLFLVDAQTFAEETLQYSMTISCR